MACEVAFTLLAVPLLGTLGPPRSLYLRMRSGRRDAYRLCSRDSRTAFPAPTQQELWSLLYLAIFVTAVAFFLWYSGGQLLKPETAGLFAGLAPVIALFDIGRRWHRRAEPRARLGFGAVAGGVVLGLRS